MKMIIITLVKIVEVILVRVMIIKNDINAKIFSSISYKTLRAKTRISIHREHRQPTGPKFRNKIIFLLF